MVEVYTDQEWWEANVRREEGDKVPCPTLPDPALVPPLHPSRLHQSLGDDKHAIQVFLRYVGGSEDDDEWLEVSSDRMRPPKEGTAGNFEYQVRWRTC